MAVREVLRWPDPRLLEIADDVPEVDDGVRALAEDLVETMYTSGGVGLAATQIGVPRRVVVVDCSPRDEDVERQPLVLINARIVEREGTILWREACLSLPGVSAEVERAEKIAVEFLSYEGTRHRLEADGLWSVCIQHELDHLDGQLYADRLGALERKATLQAYDERRTAPAEDQDESEAS